MHVQRRASLAVLWPYKYLCGRLLGLFLCKHALVMDFIDRKDAGHLTGP